MEAFFPNNRLKTIILLAICALSAVGAALVGVDDNLPGIVLALLAAFAFILAFVHPWRSPRKFLFLLLAAVLGFILFVVMSIIVDSFAQNSTIPAALRDLLQSTVLDVLNTVIAMICPAALIVGVVGWVVMSIRGRRK